MLAKREKTLLWVLCGIVGLCLAGIGVQFGLERLSDARTKVAQYETQIRKISQALPAEQDIVSRVQAMKAELDDVKSRFYKPDELSTYSFGELIKKKLAALGIAVVRYQVVETAGKSFLEFSVSGSARSIVQFFKNVSESKKYWTVPLFTLTMREGTETADGVFRIGYEVFNQ
jgi:hypothetical protein